ncbi:MAG: hypothetical protein M9932_14885 [Xanthobacteraceae bacterium]|nr:hypothetical protein [Xanthobacteraceae bacterium]
MDWDITTILKWVAIGVAASPIIVGIGWSIVEASILPRFIPRSEIDGLADDIMRRRPNDAEEAAFIEEHAAWYRSQDYEQGKWRRVRKEIRRRLMRKTATNKSSP